MNKFKSSTLWISLLSLAIIGVGIGLNIIWSAPVLVMLATIPVAYVTGNKFYDHKHGRQEDGHQESNN